MTDWAGALEAAIQRRLSDADPADVLELENFIRANADSANQLLQDAEVAILTSLSMPQTQAVGANA
jgi:hypothetical protein